MRVRTIAPAVSALGLLAVLTACGSGGVPAAAPAPSSTPVTAIAKASDATSTSTSTTPGTSAAKSGDTGTNAGDATAKSFKAELVMQRQDVAMVVLTNTSGHSVTVQGWPELVFSNAHGDNLKVPAQKVEVPGPGPSINVVAGGSVFAPVQWTEGDKGDDSTFVADGVAVIPPGANKPVDTKFTGIDGKTAGYYEIALKSVKIGTFQPDTHNLLSF